MKFPASLTNFQFSYVLCKHVISSKNEKSVFLNNTVAKLKVIQRIQIFV